MAFSHETMLMLDARSVEIDVEEIKDAKSGEAVCRHHEENYNYSIIKVMQMQLSSCNISFQINGVDACNTGMVIYQCKVNTYHTGAVSKCYIHKAHCLPQITRQ